MIKTIQDTTNTAKVVQILLNFSSKQRSDFVFNVFVYIYLI